MMHYWREFYTGNRTMEREAVRLDYTYENYKQEGCSRVEPWWIDPMQNVERYVVEKEFLRDIYANVHRYAEPDLLKLIIDMRQEGYGNYDIAREAKVSLSDYSDWGVREILEIIVSLTRNRSSSPLQRLYRDTEEYGDYESFCKWEDARENW